MDTTRKGEIVSRSGQDFPTSFSVFKCEKSIFCGRYVRFDAQLVNQLISNCEACRDLHSLASSVALSHKEKASNFVM